MRERMRRWWPWIKLLLAVAIVGGVGWQFASLLRRPELWENPPKLRPGWLLAGGALYLAAFCFPAYFRYSLLVALGQRPPLAGAARAYFVGHLGKYVPGKALALVVRADLIHRYGVRPGVTVATAVYETMTFMAGGALVAVVLLSVHALEESDRWLAALLLLLAGVPIVPGVYNRLVDRLAALARKAARRQAGTEPAASELPRLRLGSLLLGLTLSACGWCVMGLSLWATMRAVLPEPLAWSWESWGRCTAFVALAYVAGFLAFLVPGGFGIREWILQRLLTFELAAQVGPERAAELAVVLVIVLRLLWTAAEVIMAGAVSLPFLRGTANQEAPAPLTPDP